MNEDACATGGSVLDREGGGSEERLYAKSDTLISVVGSRDRTSTPVGIDGISPLESPD
ncbi:hypothetical protein ACN2C7_15395 [Caulobacter sp. ErkDOM-E]|uniref:hypothetical protein n=1 Tax=Caulobacter sp. ErkDOM-E TaxID=3402778 RepID=UPI003AF447CD